jgi:DNA end-binding protein Ku
VPRALWKGTISFGLVTIPVEVHTAVRESRPRFRLLRARDRSPIRYQRVAEKDDTLVEWDDLVKGYEYAKGRFVVLTKEDFEHAAVEKNRRIDILDFVRAGEIDDRFFDKPYYLAPAAGGAQAYALLREAIRESGRTGIGTFVLRDKQHLVAVEAIERALVLTTLRFAEEVVEPSTLGLPDAKGIRQKDLQLAGRLIENLAEEWKPEKYTDEYRENLMKIIEARRKGQTVELEAEEPRRGAEVVDLMERLRASLAQTKGKRKGTRAASRSRTKRRRAA